MLSKLIFIAAIFVCSFNALALSLREPERVCTRILSSRSDDCLDIVHHAVYFDKRALYACDRFSGGYDTVVCVSIIANKVYRAEDVANCDAYTRANTTHRCLEQLGVEYHRLSKADKDLLRTRPYAWFQKSVID